MKNPLRQGLSHTLKNGLSGAIGPPKVSDLSLSSKREPLLILDGTFSSTLSRQRSLPSGFTLVPSQRLGC